MIAADQQWVVHCWVSGQNAYTDIPDCVLGPYATSAEAVTVANSLTCSNRVDRLRLRLDPPEWTRA